MSNVALPLVERLMHSPSEIVRDGACTAARTLHPVTLGLALALSRQGIGPTDRVVVLVPPGPDLVATLLALVWLGAVPVLAEPTQSPQAFQARIAASGASHAVVDPRLRWLWRLPFAARLLSLRGTPLPPRPQLPRILALPRPARGEAPPAVPRQDDDPALVLFTSGTTSAPRVVTHTHGTLRHFLEHVRQVTTGLEVGSYLAETPQQLFYALLLDATCHVVSGLGERRLRKTLALLASGQIAAWFGSPWTWVRWLESGQPVPDSLRTILLGSAPVTAPFLRRLLPLLPDRAQVRCVYGLTEAGPVCTIDGREKAESASEGDLVGAPVDGVALRLVEDEVQVQSDSVPPSLRQEGWLPTGDLGRLSTQGLHLLGRRKDMIVRRGINLYPGVLEPLLEDPETALVGIYDTSAEDERLVLACVRPPTAAQLARLGEDAQPDHVLLVEALPRAGRQHKVDKEALRAMARERWKIPG